MYLVMMNDDYLVNIIDVEELKQKEIDKIIKEFGEIWGEDSNIIKVKTLEEAEKYYGNGESIADRIGDHLENYNYHSFTHVPYEVYCVINKFVDEETSRKIMLAMLNENTFL